MDEPGFCYIICRAQDKIKMYTPLFTKYIKSVIKGTKI